MARVQDKATLLIESEKSFKELIDYLESLSSEQISGIFPFDATSGKERHYVRDENIKDVLMHLYEWHQLLIDWVANNQAGQDYPFLKAGYNWRTYPDMNDEFKIKNDKVTYDQANAKLKQSHRAVMDLASSIPEAGFFEKKFYLWVGGSSLGSYFTSSSVSHYTWALKKIKRYIKETK